MIFSDRESMKSYMATMPSQVHSIRMKRVKITPMFDGENSIGYAVSIPRCGTTYHLTDNVKSIDDCAYNAISQAEKIYGIESHDERSVIIE